MQVLFLSQCLLVTPKRVVAGALRLTPRQLHFVGDAPMEQAAEPSGAEGPRGAGSRGARTHRHWELASIVEVQHTIFTGSVALIYCEFLGTRCMSHHSWLA